MKTSGKGKQEAILSRRKSLHARTYRTLYFLGKHEKLSIVQDCVLATSDFEIPALIVHQVLHIPDR